MGYENFSCYYMNATDVSNHEYDWTEHVKIGFTVSELLVAIVSVIGNLFIIYIFFTNVKLKKKSNYYIVSLAVGDLLLGGIGIPMSILEALCLPRIFPVCLFNMYLLGVVYNVSIFNIVAVTCDRYLAVCFPITYSTKVSIKMTKDIIYGCWVAATVVGILPLLWDRYDKYVDRCVYIEVVDMEYFSKMSMVTIIVPAIILIVLHVQIYHVILTQYNRMKRTDDPDVNTKIQKKEQEAAMKLSVIVLFFMLCSLPLFFVNACEQFGIVEEYTIDPYLIDVTIVLSHLVAAGNPFLFAFHLNDFRAAVKKMIYTPVYEPNSVSLSTSTTRIAKV